MALFRTGSPSVTIEKVTGLNGVVPSTNSATCTFNSGKTGFSKVAWVGCDGDFRTFAGTTGAPIRTFELSVDPSTGVITMTLTQGSINFAQSNQPTGCNFVLYN